MGMDMPELLEHDGDFPAVGRAGRVEVDVGLGRHFCPGRVSVDERDERSLGSFSDALSRVVGGCRCRQNGVEGGPYPSVLLGPSTYLFIV